MCAPFLADHRCHPPLDRGNGRDHHRPLPGASLEVHRRMTKVASDNPIAGLWAGDQPLILASRSAARRELLAGFGIVAELMPADLDERAIETQESARGAGVPALA